MQHARQALVGQLPTGIFVTVMSSWLTLRCAVMSSLRRNLRTRGTAASQIPLRVLIICARPILVSPEVSLHPYEERYQLLQVKTQLPPAAGFTIFLMPARLLSLYRHILTAGGELIKLNGIEKLDTIQIHYIIHNNSHLPY